MALGEFRIIAMARKDFYTIKPGLNGGWRVDKVDADHEPAGGYEISDINDRLECTCFASNRSTCRHRDMVRMYKSDAEFKAKIDSHHVYNFDTDKFIVPVQIDDV